MRKVTNPSSGAHRRDGLIYKLTKDEIQQYHELGYIVINDVLKEEEMTLLDHWFDHFVEGKVPNMDKDFCDMSQPYGTPFEEWQLVNAMLPSKYVAELKDNIYHQITQALANQLYQDGKAAMDYEQFLAKRPSKKKAEFAMHQDLGYWPKTHNTWTATFSLALTDSDLENGCLQVVPGTNNETELRAHRPKGADENSQDVNRDDSHTLVIDMKESDEIIYLPVKRGSITIHDERIVHGSGGNTSEVWRKTYVAAYRDVNTIALEREMGFTHSHNDNVDWNSIVK